MRAFPAALAAVLAVGAANIGADVWDVGGDPDNTVNSDNQLAHGVSQLHDLGALPGPVADLDYYPITSLPRASYEVVVDGQTGTSDLTFATFRRVDNDGTTELQASTLADGSGNNRILRWEHADDLPNVDYILVGPAACGTTCTASVQYRIRAYETTIAVPRFNNTGTQLTVLIIQNAATISASGTIWYWNAAGSLVANEAFTIAGRGLAVINTSSVTGLTSGSITISNTARYGTLAVKAVGVEPATGFSFDTPGMYRPH